MFIEFFKIAPVYGINNELFPPYVKELNLTVINSNPNITLMTPPESSAYGKNSARGSCAGMFMFELARFHQIPFLSVKDAMYPSLTRFFQHIR